MISRITLIGPLMSNLGSHSKMRVKIRRFLEPTWFLIVKWGPLFDIKGPTGVRRDMVKPLVFKGDLEAQTRLFGNLDYKCTGPINDALCYESELTGYRVE